MRLFDVAVPGPKTLSSPALIQCFLPAMCNLLHVRENHVVSSFRTSLNLGWLEKEGDSTYIHMVSISSHGSTLGGSASPNGARADHTPTTSPNPKFWTGCGGWESKNVCSADEPSCKTIMRVRMFPRDCWQTCSNQRT